MVWIPLGVFQGFHLQFSIDGEAKVNPIWAGFSTKSADSLRLMGYVLGR